MRFRLASFVRRFPLALALTALAACLAVAAPALAGPGADPPGSARALGALIVTPDAQLIGPEGAGNDYFGSAVAVSGDTVVVGVPLDGVGTNPLQGSACVFRRSGATWSLEGKLTAADGAAFDEFGTSVAISGDTIVVGSSGDDVGITSGQGSAYVFTRSGASWSQQAQLTAADGAALDWFGGSVAISGDTIVVGAYAHDVGPVVDGDDEGSAYVFVGGGTTWSQQAQLTATDGAAGDWFGYSVAISRDTVVVGARTDDVGGTADQGSAYVFVRSGSTWSEEAQLTAADGAANDEFGGAVAISSAAVVVGAPHDDVGDTPDQGSAHLFARSGAAWSQQAQLTAADGAAGDWFAGSAAISGATVVVGAAFDDVGANENQGSAYAFRIARPARPTARSPKGRIRSRTPSFRWRAAAGAAAYEVRVYKGGKQIKKKTGITKTSWKCTKRLPRRAWLTWKVRARNVAGYGAWSGKLRFRVR